MRWRRKSDGRPYLDARAEGLGRISLLTPDVITKYGPTPSDEICAKLAELMIADLAPTLGGPKAQKRDGIAELVRWYCKTYHVVTTEASARNREFAFARFRGWCNGNEIDKPEQFGTVQAQEFIKSMHDDKLALGTIKLYLCHVKAMYRAAMVCGIIAEMPVKKWPVVRVGRPEINPLTPAQVAEVLEYVREHRPKDAYLVALFLAATGWRISDAMALRVSDIDKGVVSRRARKTGAPIRQKLNGLALEAVAMARPKNGLVFGSIGTMEFQKYLNSVSKRLGFRVHAHLFRHSVAVQLAKDGVPVAVIADVLGHSSPLTTLKSYQHFLPSASDGAVADFGDKLRGAMENCHPNVTPMRKPQ